MKTSFLCKGILGILIILSLFLQCKSQSEYGLLTDMIKNESNAEKLKALEDIKNIYINSKFHNRRIFECALIVNRSYTNIGSIVKAADYISKIGYNTTVFIGLAQIGSICGFENPTIDKLLDLAVLSKGSGGQKIIQLGMKSCLQLSLEDQHNLQIEIDKLTKDADFKTLDEAFKDSKK